MKVRVLIGGSPCVHWSIVRQKKKQNGQRETTSSGIGYELFKNYLIAKDKFKPDFFIYENNKSISKEIKECISYDLGYTNVTIDSSLVSAQKRLREYWTNFNITVPTDRNIMLSDVLESDVEPILVCMPKFKEPYCRTYYNKSPTITAAGGGGHIPRVLIKGNDIKAVTPDNFRELSRELLPIEVERLQTMPEGYTKAVKKTHAFNGLGSGWTAEIIIQLIKYMNIPLDAEIEVLSMYDGIGTGRYCFDKLGYKNITYKAYEISNPSMTIANSNYPDIQQMGDAFDLRKDDWKY